MLSFLDKERTVARPGFSRWLIPPAALAIHLSIGQAYALSVFNLPMTRLIGVTESESVDWQLTTIGWIFSIAIVFLGLSASLFGKWLEREGPRKAMFVSALCFSGGFFVSALGVYLHQIWIVYLGYDVVGKAIAGEEAIQKAIMLNPDVIMMDISLKGEMDGVQAMEEIRKVSDVPVIYLSGNSDKFNYERAKKTNFIEYLVKPITSDDLVKPLNKALKLDTKKKLNRAV